MNQNHKIKCICRLEKNQFQQKIFVDNQMQSSSFLPEISYALQFFNAFAPEQLLRELTAHEENAVLIFRTDSAQIHVFQEFFTDST
ncbi:MAG: hypothetical protein IKI37_09765 [Oscillospiraceae bacterium]|nr:hypothetical protein [Oscillospiraceae bacterium]MBR7085441.1 hypothetical protein [Oscillospiraceae bacterium]